MLAIPRRRKISPALGAPDAERDRCCAQGLDWWYIERPGETERLWLEREFGFHQLSLGAVDDTAARIWDLLEGYLETIDTLTGAREPVTNQPINEGLCLLTAISVIVLPLTLAASVRGRNARVSGAERMAALWVVIGNMAALLIGMLAWFKHKGWL